MILATTELALIKRGRRTFTVNQQPRWQTGDVIRLRSSGKDPGFHITVTRVEQRDLVFHVWFEIGDSRPEERYLSWGWPDYTSDPFRAMRDEPEPAPETQKERKDRDGWLMLALRQTKPLPVATVSSTSRLPVERVSHAAGSDEAVRIVRRFINGA